MYLFLFIKLAKAREAMNISEAHVIWMKITRTMWGKQPDAAVSNRKTLPSVLGVVYILWRLEQLIHSITSLNMNSS